MPDLPLDKGKIMLFEGRVKRTTPFIFVFALILCASTEATSSQVRGRVSIKGSIVETACAISTENREQTIDIEDMLFEDIQRSGKGKGRAFSIELTHCTLGIPGIRDSAWKSVNLAFDGYNDSGLFQEENEAKGVALKITDHNGNVAVPGVAIPLEIIASGNMALNYFMTLVAVHRPLKVDNYFFTVRFRLDYL